jgi:hypothetical protein
MKASHVHHCWACGDVHTWVHETYACDHDADMPCPDAPKQEPKP